MVRASALDAPYRPQSKVVSDADALAVLNWGGSRYFILFIRCILMA